MPLQTALRICERRSMCQHRLHNGSVLTLRTHVNTTTGVTDFTHAQYKTKWQLWTAASSKDAFVCCTSLNNVKEI